MESPARTRPACTTWAFTPRKVKMAMLGGVHETMGFETEPLGELGTTGVGLIGDLDDRRADGKPGPGRQPGLAEVEIDVELIAGEGPPGAVAGHEVGHPGIHEIELHVRVCRPVVGAAATALAPRVTYHPVIRVELGLLEHLAFVLCGPAHNHGEGPVVTGRGNDGGQTGFELLTRSVQTLDGGVIGVHDTHCHPTDVDGANHSKRTITLQPVRPCGSPRSVASASCS